MSTPARATAASTSSRSSRAPTTTCSASGSASSPRRGTPTCCSSPAPSRPACASRCSSPTTRCRSRAASPRSATARSAATSSARPRNRRRRRGGPAGRPAHPRLPARRRTRSPQALLDLIDSLALALRAAQRIEPAPVELRRPRAEVGAERPREPALGGLLLALRDRLRRLGVERRGDARRAALLADPGARRPSAAPCRRSLRSCRRRGPPSPASRARRSASRARRAPRRLRGCASCRAGRPRATCRSNVLAHGRSAASRNPNATSTVPVTASSARRMRPAIEQAARTGDDDGVSRSARSS